jgi:maltose O-acetyltransferase
LLALAAKHLRALISIGDDVQVGPNVQFLTPTHPVAAEPRRAKLEAVKPIAVGDNVWLGGGVILCAGSASARTPSSGPVRW